MALPSPIGQNLLRMRNARGWTQEDVAARADVSVDVIARLEQGRRQTARWSTLSKVARALGVTPSALVAGVEVWPEPVEADGDGLWGIRRAVSSPDALGLAGLADFADAGPVPDIERLEESIAEVWRTWQEGSYLLLSRVVPDVIAEARHAARETTGGTNSRAQSALATAYQVAAGVACMLDAEDLAFLAVERSLRAADETGDPLLRASAANFLSWVYRRQGRFAECEAVAVRAAEAAEPSMVRATPRQLAVFGGLLLNASGAAARAEATVRAHELIVVARTAAVRLGQDREDSWSVFGPTTTAMTEVNNLVELGEMDEALRKASEIPASGGAPPTWEARYLLNVAAAQVETSDNSGAVDTLWRAKEVAPEWIRYHTLGPGLVRELLGRNGNRRRERLHELASHLQVA